MADARAAPEALEHLSARIPVGLRQEVKLAAVRKEMSVQEVVTEALRQWLEREAADK